jgi:hypothetical protein
MRAQGTDMRLLKAARLITHCSVHRAALIPRSSHLHRGESTVDAGRGCCLGGDHHEEGVAGVTGGARQLRRKVCQLSVIIQPTLVRRPAVPTHDTSASSTSGRHARIDTPADIVVSSSGAIGGIIAD